MIIAEYIWLDSENKFRYKTRVINEYIKDICPKYFPEWNFDGSSTGQADTNDSEIILKPVYICNDPFRKINKNICLLVLCDTWKNQDTPTQSNTRAQHLHIFQKFTKEQPLFGIEQEFFLIDIHDDLNENNHKNSYCRNLNSYDKDCVEEAFILCIKAGIKITGYNSEVGSYQWELQVCDYGITAADQLIMLRYILEYVTKKHNFVFNMHPKPLSKENGSGCHVNFSTKKMRDLNSFDLVSEVVNKLKINHEKHISKYGSNNNLRLTGTHETSSYDTFTFGKGDRTASVRIPTNTNTYIEDRRPASNMDPYVVLSSILETCCSSSTE